MREAYSHPPVSAGPAPYVNQANGRGRGGSAGVQAPDASHGYVAVSVGDAPNRAGFVTLIFADPVPAMHVPADEDFGTVTPSIVGKVLFIRWENAALKAGTKPRLNFEIESLE